MPQFNSGFFIHRANANRVLQLAIEAAPQESSIPLASLGVLHLVDMNATAMHTARIRAPAHTLQKLDCGEFIGTSQGNLLDDWRARQLMFAILFCHDSIMLLSASCVKYKITERVEECSLQTLVAFSSNRQAAWEHPLLDQMWHTGSD